MSGNRSPWRSRARMALLFRGLAARLRLSRRSSLILRYHSVAPAGSADYVSPGISLPPERFEEHLRFLSGRYDLIDLEEVLRRAREGRPGRGRPGVALTFDDGYRDNLRHALPVLERWKAPATVYVVAEALAPGPTLWSVRLHRILTRSEPPNASCPLPVPLETGEAWTREGAARRLTRWLRARGPAEREELLEALARWLGVDEGSGAEAMLDADELRLLARRGVSIGSHTCTHPLLTALARDEAREEIARSRTRLEEICGSEVLHFSYPNPGRGAHHDAAVRELVREAGYLSATTSDRGLAGADLDPLALRRIGVNTGVQERILFRALGERP